MDWSVSSLLDWPLVVSVLGIMATLLAPVMLGPVSALYVEHALKQRRMKRARNQVQIAITTMFVTGIGTGISTANTATDNRLFCPPDNLGLVKENYLDILEKQIAKVGTDDTKYQDIPNRNSVD
jgi:hypothetical protein